MIVPYFGDIRNIILQNLRDARFDIYVAVAWFTDKQIFDLLIEKCLQGLNIEVAIIKDDINIGNGFDYDFFVENGGKLFWDDHHHKFCVIDREVVITGSYNWTYKASNRIQRENIIVISSEKELIDKYSYEFRTLQKKAERYMIQPAQIIIEKETLVIEEKVIERIVEDIIIDQSIRKASWFDTHQKRTDWWKSLNDKWISVFLESQLIKSKNKPTKEELQFIFNSTKLEFSSNNEILHDTIGLQNLSRLRIVTGLNLSDNCIRVLKQILPDCKIE
jgi:phosphatidylserine/phosphatidylglycerophosphate/cardiolipin synthase-like enzyme